MRSPDRGAPSFWKGGLLFHQDQTAAMKLTATKSFSNIVKLTYEPQYDRHCHVN